MEENRRFRNHISIVAERIGGFTGAVLLFAATSLADEIEGLLNGTTVWNDEKGALLAAAGVFILLLLLFVGNIIAWAKTYISVQDGNIVLERNTLNSVKNTIAIRNISNVNTEQNLFEMLLGTCKVKLDTDTLSTSEQTDVKIVLKKKEAEEFRRYIMRLMAECGGKSVPLSESGEVEIPADIRAKSKDIFAHGLYSVNVCSILVVVGCITGVAGAVLTALEDGNSGRGILEVLLSLVVVIIALVSAVWDTLKDFIRYIDFSIGRKEDKIYIRYGVLKKVNYTIPVEKINALELKQSLLARIAGRYKAEIVNIGMGDDGAEQESFLFPYCKEEVMRERLAQILPEFVEVIDAKAKRQTKAAWLAYLVPVALYLAGITAAGAAGIYFFPLYRGWIIAGCLIFSAWLFLLLVAYCFAAGSSLGEQYLVIAGGYFGRTVCGVSYDKIQYIELKQNPTARAAGIQKGEVHLLASARNRVKNIPYLPEEDAERIKKRILKRTAR